MTDGALWEWWCMMGYDRWCIMGMVVHYGTEDALWDMKGDA